MQKTSREHKDYKTIEILNVKVDFIDKSKALLEIEKWIDTNKKYQIVSPNPEQIVLARKDYRFRKILNEVDLRIADGVGLVWAARWLVKHQRANLCALRSLTQKIFSSNRPREESTYPCSQRRDAVPTLRRDTKKENFWQAPHAQTVKKALRTPRRWLNRLLGDGGIDRESSFHRLAGIDLMVGLCQLAAQKGWRVFLLGGKNNVAQKATASLKNLSSSRLTIESFGGAVEIASEGLGERKKTIEKINKFKPHFLFVAYGAPWQEKWIYDNLPKLNARVAMGVGGAFDYLAGQIQRAPVCIRSLGFEWLWRLLHQPWRIRRQLALTKFVYLVIKDK